MSAAKCTPTPSSEAIALNRARLARLIAALFSGSAAEASGHLSARAVQAELIRAARALGIDPRLCKAVFAGLFTAECDGDGDGESGGAESLDRLLGHTVRCDCSAYELEYRASEVFQQAQTLADVAGFYRAFGFDAAGPMADRPDHVAAEWEFLAVLAVMEARAADTEQAERCIEAQRDFLCEHAAGWMPALFERIKRADPAGCAAKVADLAEAVLREWCGVRDVSPGPKWLELRPISDEDSTITCGAPGAVELGPTLAAAMQERA